MASFKFVDTNVASGLVNRMIKGGLSATTSGIDEVTVLVAEGEEWADTDAWIRAIEEHYACVFDDLAE